MAAERYATAVERRLDVRVDITRDWFRSYVSELEKHTLGFGNVDCDVRLGPDFDNRIVFQDRQTWLDFVLTHWEQVTETNIWPIGGRIRRASCHHRRHHVLLRVEGDAADDIDKTFEDLCQRLSLAKSPENPYRYRRSALEFEIGNWRPDYFVEGVKKISELLGPDPAVPEAYAKSFEGDIEKLTSYFDLETFCKDVGTVASRFTEVVIQLQGRSIAVGMAVTSDHKKLRIRTSIPTGEVDALIKAWPESLKLKPTKAADGGGGGVGGTAPVALESAWLKHGITVAVALITAASASGIVSLHKSIWPDYKVVVVTPYVENGMAKLTGNMLPLDWYLQPVQASIRAVKRDAVATVRVHAASGFRPPVQSKPPLSISLEEGTFVVLVDVPEATPSQFQVVVPPAARPGPPAPGK